jgi:hypothetical protein
MKSSYYALVFPALHDMMPHHEKGIVREQFTLNIVRYGRSHLKSLAPLIYYKSLLKVIKGYKYIHRRYDF